MTESNTPDNVREYLARLEAAMAGIPEETTRDIVGAIREELYGLDAAAAAKRIRRFGDPQFIASEARAAGATAADASAADPTRADARETSATATSPTASPAASASEHDAGAPVLTDIAPVRRPATGEPRWYAVISALVLMFGSFVVPVLGTLAGFVMIWFSKAWTRTEKWIATLIPIASFAIIAIASRLPRSVADPEENGGGEFHAPTIEQFMPNTLMVWHLGIIILALVPIAVGIGLLWRAVRGWSATDRG